MLSRCRFVGLPLLICGSLVGSAAASDTPSARIVQAEQVVARFARPGEPGCVVGAYQSGRALVRTAFGLADMDSGRKLTPESVLGAASISKQFTAATVALAAELKYLSLDDDIRKFLPELPDYGSKISVRDLIHHVSGLRDFNHLIKLSFKPELYRDKGSIVALVARQKGLNFSPRAEFSYNNSGYLLLAEIVQRATGRSLQTFAQEHLFGPLGMAHTGFSRAAAEEALRTRPYSRVGDTWQLTPLENAITPGPGGLMTTVDDYQRWGSQLMSSATPLAGGSALLKTLLRPATLLDGTTTSYAFGLEIAPYKGFEAISHGGSGFGYKTYGMIFPQQSLVVVSLCNNGSYADALTQEVADALLGVASSTTATPSASFVATAEQLRDFVGFYRDPKVFFPRVVTLRDGQLQMKGDVIERVLEPVAPARFRASGVKGEFAFDGARLRQLESSLSSGSSVFERIEPATPNAAALQGYAGRYFSPELNTEYLVAVEAGRLTVRGASDRKGSPGPLVVLQPMLKDEFWSPENRLIAQFVRDPGNRVQSLQVSAQFGWIRRLEFVRVPAPNGAGTR
ncbi:serine hydrolase domain-containing protein [Steroidobacter sp.]|uniref:serine hydrolase domain-containing protein n=1 Tax=Steroidobacter sp. TaxID=1978227 RepID=UPI0025E9765D|nr:serine hydrolase domain-containing protein [Steroidobacter sp.]